MSDLAAACRLVSDQAQRQGVEIALVGGFAVSVRTEPRFTRDIDLVVAVSDDEVAAQGWLTAGSPVRFLRTLPISGIYWTQRIRTTSRPPTTHSV